MARSPSKTTIRVLVVDDHPIFRDGLCKLLEAEDDVTVVGQGRSGAECVALVEKLKPDVVLLDLKMPDQDGLEVLRGLAGLDTGARVIVLTASEDERDYVEAVRRGARGLVLKQMATARLLEGIRKVHRGELWINRRVAADVLKAAGQPVPGESLTAREKEVVKLVAQGFRNKEIAEKLALSEQTVKNHLHAIFDKLGVSDRLELALYALHHRLTG